MSNTGHQATFTYLSEGQLAYFDYDMEEFNKRTEKMLARITSTMAAGALLKYDHRNQDHMILIRGKFTGCGSRISSWSLAETVQYHIVSGRSEQTDLTEYDILQAERRRLIFGAVINAHEVIMRATQEWENDRDARANAWDEWW